MEAQQDDATREQTRKPPASPEELARQERRRALELSRRRMADDLARASAPAHRKMLEEAIAALEQQLAALDHS